MRDEHVEFVIQMFNRGVWETAKEYVVDGQTYVHAPAGTRYRIVLTPTFYRSINCYKCVVDGHPVNPYTTTFVSGPNYVHGFVKHLDEYGNLCRLEDTLPFRTAPIVNARVENKTLPSKIGTIAVNLYENVQCDPWKTEVCLTAISSGTPAATNVLPVNLDHKAAVFDEVKGVKSSVGTVLPTTADVGRVLRHTVITTNKSNYQKSLTIRYSEDLDMLRGIKPIAAPAEETINTMKAEPKASAGPIEVVDLTRSVIQPPAHSNVEQTVSGHKRSRPEGVVDLVDLSEPSKGGVVSQFLKLSVVWNDNSVNRHTVTFMTPMAVEECRASVRSLPDPRLAELLFRAAEALPPNSSRTKDLPTTLPLWSADGKPLKSFEEALKVKEVVLGTVAQDNFKEVVPL